MSEAYWDRWLRRRYSRRAFVAGSGATAVGTAALLSAGCGDDDDDDDAEPGGETPGATDGNYGGTYTITTLDPYRGLDPAINTQVPTMHAAKVYSKTHLFQVSQQKVLLDMATSYEVVDPTTITYTIRPDIAFHDVEPMNGRLATAEDLVYTWRRFEEVGEYGSTLNASAWTFLDLANTEATDATTVTVKLKTPFADALAAMGQPFYGMVAREAVEANDGNLTAVSTAGAGPYLLDPSSNVSQLLRWVRNPNYFSHDHSDPFWFPENGAYIDTIEMAVNNDQGAIQAQLLAGDLDVLDFNALNVDSILAEEFSSSDTLNVFEGDVNDHVALGIVQSRIHDTRLRQAIQRAIDYEGYIDTIYLGEAKLGAPVGGAFPDTVRLPESELSEYLKFDPTDAKALWDAADGPDKLVLLSIAQFPFMESACSYIQQSLQQSLGIEVEIQASDVPSWLARVTGENKDYDLYVFFDQSLPDLPNTNALANYNPAGSTLITTQFSPDSEFPEVADLADEMLGFYTAQSEALTPEDRTGPIHEMQRFALDNAIPAIPLPVRTKQYVVVNKRVKNVEAHLTDLSFWNNNLTQNVYLDPA